MLNIDKIIFPVAAAGGLTVSLALGKQTFWEAPCVATTPSLLTTLLIYSITSMRQGTWRSSPLGLMGSAINIGLLTVGTSYQLSTIKEKTRPIFIMLASSLTTAGIYYFAARLVVPH